MSKTEVPRMNTFKLTRKRPFDCNRNRWNDRSPSRFKRLKSYESHDFARRVDNVCPRDFQPKTRVNNMEGPPTLKMTSKHDFSRRGEVVPSRFEEHDPDYLGNRFCNLSRGFSRKCARFQNPSCDYSRKFEAVSPRFEAKEGPTSKMNPAHDVPRNSDSVSPLFQARSMEIPKERPMLNLIPTGHFTRKCDYLNSGSQVRTSDNTKERIIETVNKRPSEYAVSPRFRYRPSEYAKEVSTVNVNPTRDFARNSVSPRFRYRPSEYAKEVSTVKVNPTRDFARKCEAGSPPQIERRTSESSQGCSTAKMNPYNSDSSGKFVDDSLQVHVKNNENPLKVKPSEILAPSVPNSEFTKSMVSRDNFKRRKVDAVRNFPKHFGVLVPQIKPKTFETPCKVKPSKVLMPCVVNSAPINPMVSSDKFKGREIEAVHDFPKHFGAFVPQIKPKAFEAPRGVKTSEVLMPCGVNSESIKSIVSRDNFKCRKVDAVCDFPKHCGALTPQVKSKAFETPCGVKFSEVLMPCALNSESTKSVVSPDNSKHRMVDAVRVFPKHCGALAPRVTIKRLDDNSIVIKEDDFKSSEVSSSSIRKPNSTKSKVVDCNIQAIDPGLEVADMESMANRLKVDSFLSDDVDSVLNEPNLSNDRETVLSEPTSTNGSENFAWTESINSSHMPDHSPKCGLVNHAFNPKNGVAPIDEQIQRRNSFEINLEENDSEKHIRNFQCESTQLSVSISSYGNEENRNAMGNSPIYPSRIELSPFEEHSKKAFCKDVYGMVDAEYLTDSDLLPNKDKFDVLEQISADASSECGHVKEGKNEIGNSPIYTSASDLSPLEEHGEEACSEEDCYIVEDEHRRSRIRNLKNNFNICNSVLLPNQDKVETLRRSYSNERLHVPSLDSDESKGKHLNDLNGPFGDGETVCKRKQVMEALDSYGQILAKLVEDYKAAESKGKGKVSKQVHIEAAMLLKREKFWVNTKDQLGHVPGVEVGDRFRFRAELVCIGLHHQFQSGIDYMKKDGKILATSIVDSGRYTNSAEFSDVLRYSGQGGNPTLGKDKQPHDQKLVRGNLALKNSMEAKAPVRVIRKTMKNGLMYFYDGLYVVTEVTQERSVFGKLVYMFLLNRIIRSKTNR